MLDCTVALTKSELLLKGNRDVRAADDSWPYLTKGSGMTTGRSAHLSCLRRITRKQVIVPVAKLAIWGYTEGATVSSNRFHNTIGRKGGV